MLLLCVLQRGREASDLTLFVSFISLSSGGSDRGEDVAVKGLEGRLSSSAALLATLSCGSVVDVWMLVCLEAGVVWLARRQCRRVMDALTELLVGEDHPVVQVMHLHCESRDSHFWSCNTCQHPAIKCQPPRGAGERTNGQRPSVQWPKYLES